MKSFRRTHSTQTSVTAGARAKPAVADAPPSETTAPDTTHAEAVESGRQRAFRYVFAVTRLSLGWVFLWAFLDKTFALGFSTGVDPETGAVDRFGDAAWVNGGSPTDGYLSSATKGPLADFYQGFAGAAWADWLFMLGLLGVGLTMMLGVAMRVSAACGALLMVLMWSSALPPASNPFMDDHIVYALVLVALALAGAGYTLGLGRMYDKIPVVAHHAWLK
jgi:thiosulfate dehydrogenase (quinone) large subunit